MPQRNVTIRHLTIGENGTSLVSLKPTDGQPANLQQVSRGIQLFHSLDLLKTSGKRNSKFPNNGLPWKKKPTITGNSEKTNLRFLAQTASRIQMTCCFFSYTSSRTSPGISVWEAFGKLGLHLWGSLKCSQKSMKSSLSKKKLQAKGPWRKHMAQSPR